MLTATRRRRGQRQLCIALPPLLSLLRWFLVLGTAAGLKVGQLVTLLNDEKLVRDSFKEIREYGWDDQMKGMLGRVYQVIAMPTSDIGALPSPDGSQGRGTRRFIFH